jgi:hypothetical protein
MEESLAKNDLLRTLVKQAKGYVGQVPVFRIEQPSAEDSVKQACALATRVWPQFGDCKFRPEHLGDVVTLIRLPDDGHVRIFHPSGAITGLMRPKAARKLLAPDERKANRKPLVDLARRMATAISKLHAGPDDELRFESRWEMKGQGVTIKGKKGPVSLFEVLGAFRRYLHGLPVLGRASVHVGVGGDSQVTRWGIDWRRVWPAPFAQTEVVPPEEGAKRVLNDLWWRRPERPFTLKDFEPKSFTLGYLSLSRRRAQFVMQPVWLAVLAPSGVASMGHVIAVPAAPQAFEPIDRPLPPVQR